ncbi:myosin-crossreactive antigen [Streptomyces laurentii]|uniref:Myosin-crossreactive antigen n=1 Tax=Streptomyces laurentii TaxID=39478 RepID=A0A160P4G2_STRLU|nr:myosin-crossreactive antigen [Streptomyces laurentii]
MYWKHTPYHPAPEVPVPATRNSKIYLVGGGVASLAAAAFLVRDAGVPGENVHILEQLSIVGGSMDGAPAPTPEGGYVTRGGRMFEEEHYVCLWNLLETIPTLDDPAVSVRQEMLAFNIEHPTNAKARIINADRTIADAARLGLDARDRADMTRLLALPERVIGARRIDDFFQPHFFTTNFWCMWRTTFAFQTWHSAIELKRYFLAFVQEFDRIHTLSGVRRSKYNQYDSVIRPIKEWLAAKGVRTDFGVTVADVEFSDPAARRISRLRLERDGAKAETIELGEDDYAFLTIGSMTADATYGDRSTVPELIRDKRDGSWRLWESIAKQAPDFGRPTAFCGNIDETKWESFTLTMTGRTLLDRIQEYTGNVPGEGALMTWKDSGWLLSIVVPAQPHFRDQEENTYTLWGTRCSATYPVTTSRRRWTTAPAPRSSTNSSAISASTTSRTRCAPPPRSPPSRCRTSTPSSSAASSPTAPASYRKAPRTSPSSASSSRSPRASSSPSSTRSARP